MAGSILSLFKIIGSHLAGTCKPPGVRWSYSPSSQDWGGTAWTPTLTMSRPSKLAAPTVSTAPVPARHARYQSILQLVSSEKLGKLTKQNISGLCWLKSQACRPDWVALPSLQGPSAVSVVTMRFFSPQLCLAFSPWIPQSCTKRWLFRLLGGGGR